MRCTLKCRAPASREVSHEQMRYDNDFNIIPFEVGTEQVEVCQRGIELKYVAQQMVLFVTMR
jgi:hypothetical protein